MFNDNFMDIICLVCGVAAIGSGIYELVTGKAFGRDLSKIDKATAREFTKREAFVYLAMGVVIIIMSLIMMYNILPMFCYWIGLGLIIAAIIADSLLAKKYLH